MDKYEIEQQQVGQTCRELQPVAAGLRDPNPRHYGNQGGMRDSNHDLNPQGPLVKFGHKMVFILLGMRIFCGGGRWPRSQYAIGLRISTAEAKLNTPRGTKVVRSLARIAGYNLSTLPMSSYCEGDRAGVTVAQHNLRGNLFTSAAQEVISERNPLPQGPKPSTFSALFAGLKACSTQKLNCRSLPLVGMTSFFGNAKALFAYLFSYRVRDSRPCKMRKDGAPLVRVGLGRSKAWPNYRSLPLIGMTNPILTVMLIFAFLGPAAAASQWGEPGRELARKIAEVTGPGAVAVEVGNRSSLSKADVAAVRTAVEGELGARGVHLTARDQAAAVVIVSLSENVREYVWVAEIWVGKNDKSVVMVSLARAEAGAVQAAGSGVVLRKQLLWTQEEAILDVAGLDAADKSSGAHMAVLDGSKVTLLHLEKEKGKWLRDQELAVQHERAWPRDLRGRLVVGKDHLLDVYLPGVFCSTTQRGAMALECAAKDEGWPVDSAGSGPRFVLDAKKNYFTGTFLERTSDAPNGRRYVNLPDFYSAVALPREKYVLWIFTAVDGSVHAVDGMTDQVWRGVPWGSDVAAVHTGCGGGWQVVASGKTDTGNDELKVYDVPDREPMAMSAGLSFPGRVTALWAGAGAEALVVVRNGDAGRYEAYRVGFTCGE